MEFRIFKWIRPIKAKKISGDMGLSNIRESVKTLGGTVQITHGEWFSDLLLQYPKSVSN